MFDSFYTRSSRNATDLSLGHLSEDVQLLGFKLKSQIASLRPRLNHHRQLGSVSGDYKNASNTVSVTGGSNKTEQGRDITVVLLLMRSILF